VFTAGIAVLLLIGGRRPKANVRKNEREENDA